MEPGPVGSGCGRKAGVRLAYSPLCLEGEEVMVASPVSKAGHPKGSGSSPTLSAEQIEVVG